MNTRGILTTASALALLLGGAAACSSDDAESASPGGAATPTSSSPTATAPAKPAVVMMGHGGGVGTYCMVPTRHGRIPDFVWTGIRLEARDAATITTVTAQRQGVDVLHSWVVGGGNGNTGAIVPWSDRNTFLRHLDWPHRTVAKGADLTAGTPYTLVMRLRPQDSRQPGMLQDLAVHYRSAAGRGSDVARDILKFDRAC